LLILDEPTNGLDPRGMKDVRDLLTGLAQEKGTTVFVSSHLLAEVQQMCTRVGILDQGRLVSESSTDGDIEALYLATTSGSIQ
jgi:ABC-2 type transport system ATP-binding protein